MIYYKDNEIIIRNMGPCDVQIITDEGYPEIVDLVLYLSKKLR